MRFVNLSVVIGVVFCLLGQTESFNLLQNKIQRNRNFAQLQSTTSTTGSACTIPAIEDTTTQSQRDTKGPNIQIQAS